MESTMPKAADRLHGSLLLAHGSSDDNVHFQNSVQMVDALIKAGKQFRFMIYPNKAHGIGGSSSRVHLFHMIEDQFERDLKVAQPSMQSDVPPDARRFRTHRDLRRKYRHRHQQPFALRPCRMEYRAARRPDWRDLPERAILRAGRRVAARAASARARCRQLHQRQLRSADRERPNAPAKRRPGDRSWHLGPAVSWTYSKYAGCNHRERRPHSLLYLRSDSHHRAHRSYLGDGFRSFPPPDHRKPEALLRAGNAGKVANHL